MANSKVLVGMSGGIDSSVAAILLAEQGYTPIGITMIFDTNYSGAERAEKVVRQLGIQHHTVDLKETFSQQVIDYFFYEYLKGRTPNPCLRCNQTIKWPWLFSMAKQLDCDFCATGHYVVKSHLSGHTLLKKAFDPNKDQSFFLWHLTPQQVNKCLFPLGSLPKSEIVHKAQTYGLGWLKKEKTSTGLCFIQHDYRLFIKNIAKQRNINIPEGAFYDLHGTWLGRHKGIAYYTVGQRKGLGIKANKPLFVNKIDATNHSIILSDFPSLFKDCFLLEKAVLNFPIEFEHTLLEIRVRYRGKAVFGTVVPNKEGFLLRLKTPEWSVAPGQGVALYKNNFLIGGGFVGETNYKSK